MLHNKKTLRKLILEIILCVLIFTVAFYFVNQNAISLKKNAKMTIGSTTEVFRGSRNTIYIEYKYYVEGKEYTSKSQIANGDIIIASDREVIVIYDSTNISKSAVILDANDIKSYQKSQIDSLFNKRVRELNIWNWHSS
jgi:hypothetical protein